MIIQPQFDKADDFSEGFAAVEIDGKVGYINRSGKIIIKPRFVDARKFREGLAAVELDDKWGFIDKAGNLKIKPQFDEALDYQRGLAVVVTIDSPGGGLTAPGISITHVEGKWGYINKFGHYVWQSQVD